MSGIVSMLAGNDRKHAEICNVAENNPLGPQSSKNIYKDG